MTPKEILEKIEIPDHNRSTSIKDNEAEFIYSFLKENGITETLETGFAYAKSAVFIIAATQSAHISIDPFQDHYENIGLKNIKKLGFDKFLNFYNDYSHNVLPKLLAEKRQFNFIFIDGDHKFDGELVDFYYADLLLKEKGYILLHDTWMRSTRLLMKFIKTNRKDYIQIKTSLRNFALFQKINKDPRDGMFFKEFYSIKSILSFRVITWLATGNQGALKRLVFRIKERIK